MTTRISCDAYQFGYILMATDVILKRYSPSKFTSFL